MATILVPIIAEYVGSTLLAEVITMALTLVASSIIAKLLAPNIPSAPQLPIMNQQIQPATNNKLPVVYGTAYVGGIITDMSISSDNQDIYWVFALSEVTNTETGGTPDVITFGNIYWGGKKVLFGTGAAVTGLKVRV